MTRSYQLLFLQNGITQYKIGFNSFSSKSRESTGYSLSTYTQYTGIFNEYTLSTSYAYNESSSSFSKIIGYNLGNIDFEKDIKNNKTFIYNTIYYSFDDSALIGKHRIQKAMGLGYYLFKKDRFYLKTMAGPAAIFNTGGGIVLSLNIVERQFLDGILRIH